LIGVPAAWALLAAAEVHVSQLAIVNESVQLLNGNAEPLGGFFRCPKNGRFHATRLLRTHGEKAPPRQLGQKTRGAHRAELKWFGETWPSSAAVCFIAIV
jgi:hypothetical protein